VPFYIQRAHVELNIIHMQDNPSPQGEVFTDPLSGAQNRKHQWNHIRKFTLAEHQKEKLELR
jgi:hypothetical protein